MGHISGAGGIKQQKEKGETMHTKRIVLSAIIAALPFTAMAENISGAMYTAPAQYDNNHPAPTTNAYAPYGRINIDTDDQEHIATTAYVKGAYNSAIAGINKVNDTIAALEGEYNYLINETIPALENSKQNKLDYDDDVDGTGEVNSSVIGSGSFLDALRGDDIGNNYYDGFYDSSLISAKAVAEGILSQRVTIYTTWDDDSANATTQVALSTAQ